MCTIYIQKLSMGQQLNDRYTENTAGKSSGAEITKKYDQQAVLVVKSDWGEGHMTSYQKTCRIAYFHVEIIPFFIS
uniref:Uncharacterized protein n=1 Tax=Anguilla anguilla TaxID=7936 RepID=A0A0E9XAQ4_ANGAN